MLVAQSCLTLRAHDLWSTRLFCPWNSPGKSAGVGSHSLLQGIFLTQGSNSGLSHCRQILYHLSDHPYLKINPARPLGGQWDRLPMTSVNHTGLSDFCSHYFLQSPCSSSTTGGQVRVRWNLQAYRAGPRSTHWMPSPQLQGRQGCWRVVHPAT